MDENEENRVLMLQAIANTVFKYQETRNAFQFARGYLMANEVSKDLDMLLG